MLRSWGLRAFITGLTFFYHCFLQHHATRLTAAAPAGAPEQPTADKAATRRKPVSRPAARTSSPAPGRPPRADAPASPKPVVAKSKTEWDAAVALMQAGTPWEGTVELVNRGGVIVRVGRLPGFIPFSQLDPARIASVRGGVGGAVCARCALHD